MLADASSTCTGGSIFGDKLRMAAFTAGPAAAVTTAVAFTGGAPAAADEDGQ
ncbi:hypothetical protein [Nonomuraea polychroma]|uniref:hypothetical protein n=1 Tax=Nonomuraea polychroma TaxID=46176 RepID=UPI003BA8FA06